MDANAKKLQEMRVALTVKALKANNMEAVYLPTKTEVIPMVRSLMAKGSSCAVGGSTSLFECDIFSLLRNGDYKFYDRYEKGLAKEQIREIYLASFDVDTYLSSANAITEHGELYNVDNTGNRVSALSYGPRQVIVIAGANKIVPDLASAVVRVKEYAAPGNAIRLDRETFCLHHGRCLNPVCDSRSLMAVPAGSCQETLCSTTLILSRQREKGRIKVLIVGEPLGY